MTYLQFIADIIRSLSNAAWPVCIVIFLSIYRKDIIKQLPNLSIDYKGIRYRNQMREIVQNSVNDAFQARDNLNNLILDIHNYNNSELLNLALENNGSIKDLSKKFTKERETFYNNHQNASDEITDAAFMRLVHQQQREWNEHLSQKTRVIIRELLIRLKREHSNLDFSIDATVNKGHLAGPNPLEDVANYIEDLVNQINRTL